MAAIETYQKLLDRFETKLPLASVRYKVGQILFDRGDLKGAGEVWQHLAGTPNDLLWKIGKEKLDNAQWQDDYTKYTNRIPAMAHGRRKGDQSVSSGTIDIIQSADLRMKKIFEVAESVAVSRASILITGESGTGKELLARLIHAKSPRAARRVVAVTCAAVPEGLLESELFGYERGAFTGADQRRKAGKFEMAQDSTFLLDEISEMPLALQAKMLRVLQEGEIERLGGVNPVKTNVRVIATTNRSLEKMVKEGGFREDLYYRLNVIPLQIPPLRGRPLDIESLTAHFAAASCAENGVGERKVFSEAALCANSSPIAGRATCVNCRT